ncbi:cytochrome c oxidase assembly protein [Woodsholea maritima]|uniref:cytochrome c oxidase assembly protein n=1 Tax=Woodsholea maritima TaxID=240237 RepID=UPI0003698A0B|nr:cytochrome c oxidase assembly protein [Woodsholea maritima]
MKFLRDKNTRVLTICLAAVVTMVGMAYAAVPLYNLFCRVTGYGGTTQVAEADTGQVLDRTVEIRFDASTDHSMPWVFEPVQTKMTVHIGESVLAYYRATNPTNHPITGVATYNITPFKAAPYFSKIECFCFTEQTLAPGESMDMPVLFFVDPDLDETARLDDVRIITLSYTFYEAESDETNISSAGPDRGTASLD